SKMNVEIVYLYEVYRTDGCGEGRYLGNIGYYLDKNLADFEHRKSLQDRSVQTIPALFVGVGEGGEYYPLKHKGGVQVNPRTISHEEIKNHEDETLRNKTLASLS